MSNFSKRSASVIRISFRSLISQDLALPSMFEKVHRLRDEALINAASGDNDYDVSGCIALIAEMDEWYKAQQSRPPSR